MTGEINYRRYQKDGGEASDDNEALIMLAVQPTVG